MKLLFRKSFSTVPWFFFNPSLKSFLLYRLEYGMCNQFSCITTTFRTKCSSLLLQFKAALHKYQMANPNYNGRGFTILLQQAINEDLCMLNSMMRNIHSITYVYIHIIHHRLSKEGEWHSLIRTPNTHC